MMKNVLLADTVPSWLGVLGSLEREMALKGVKGQRMEKEVRRHTKDELDSMDLFEVE